MAGHSKWANIKHRKARADAKKGKAFSKVTKEIISAVRMGGADPKSNTRLRLALAKAKAVNLPQENIQRNIKKASSKDAADYHNVTYEFYGAGGIGIICCAVTDNKNRCASEMRILQNKTSARLADPGSVLFNFDEAGVIQVQKEKSPLAEEELFDLAITLGATDFLKEEELYRIVTETNDLHSIYEKLMGEGVQAECFEIEYLPKMHISCSEEDMALNDAILDRLSEIDDIDDVYHNMEEN